MGEGLRSSKDYIGLQGGEGRSWGPKKDYIIFEWSNIAESLALRIGRL